MWELITFATVNFGALLGLYIWTFKQIEGIKQMLRDHEKKVNQHVDSKELVFRDVCELQVKQFHEQLRETKEDVKETKSDVKQLRADVASGFGEIKVLLQQRH